MIVKHENQFLSIEDALKKQFWPHMSKGHEILLSITCPYSHAVAILLCLKNGFTPVLNANHSPKFVRGLLNDKRRIMTDEASVNDEFCYHIPYIEKINATSTEYLIKYFNENRELFSEKSLFFLTSGSTGQPKFIEKKWKDLLKEMELFAHLFKLSKGSDFRIHATVSHDHIYGFSHTIILPLWLNIPLYEKRLDNLTLLKNHHEQDIIVTSPPQLKHYCKAEEFSLKPQMILTAGAPLDEETIAQIITHNLPVIDIYGSTETGAIAYKDILKHHDSHGFFPYVDMKREKDKVFVHSPYIDAYFPLEDMLSFSDDGRFKIEGRKDDIVKIGGKRVSLIEVKKILQKSPMIKDCHILFNKINTNLSAYISLSDEGQKLFNKEKIIGLRQKLRLFLRHYLISEACPKNWFIIDEIPRNTQGKIIVDKLINTAEKKEELVKYPIVKEYNPDSGHALLNIEIPENLLWFDGHFEKMPILPGVVQLDWVIYYLSQALGRPCLCTKVNRIKYTNIITPKMNLQLHIQWKDNRVKFIYQKGEIIYSRGDLVFAYEEGNSDGQKS